MKLGDAVAKLHDGAIELNLLTSMLCLVHGRDRVLEASINNIIACLEKQNELLQQVVLIVKALPAEALNDSGWGEHG